MNTFLMTWAVCSIIVLISNYKSSLLVEKTGIKGLFYKSGIAISAGLMIAFFIKLCYLIITL